MSLLDNQVVALNAAILAVNNLTQSVMTHYNALDDLSKEAVGLGNVANLSPLNLPLSTAFNTLMRNNLTFDVDYNDQIRLVDKTKFTRVNTRNFYPDIYGGGGQWRLDPDDNATVDDGTLCVVGLDGGRWKRDDIVSMTERSFGGRINGFTNDIDAVRKMVATGNWDLLPGNRVLREGIFCTQPVSIRGKGVSTLITLPIAFSTEQDLFTLSPAAGTEKRNWIFENFNIVNSGSGCRDTFRLDLAAAGQFLNKLLIQNIVSDATNGYFVNLINSIPNDDGLFCSNFLNCWSLKGYRFKNVGDSVVVDRATVSGHNLAFYFDQLPTASHFSVTNGNITSDKGAIRVTRGKNGLFQRNQVECPEIYMGTDPGLVTAANDSGAREIFNFNVTNNSINCQVNSGLYCISLNDTDNAFVEANDLYCHPSTGQHIEVKANALGTRIGCKNKYLSTTTGAEITPRILDNGIGTMGIWKTATLAWGAPVDAPTDLPTGFFKSVDNVVTLRGNLISSASTASQTVFILPPLFRPMNLIFRMWSGNTVGSDVAIQILPTGEVQIVNAGITRLCLNGISFSTVL